MDGQHLGAGLLVTFFFHLPFGFYGARFRRFSRAWGRCLYIPILLTIFLRRYLGIGYEHIPYFVVIALSGQVVGKQFGKQSLSPEQY